MALCIFFLFFFNSRFSVRVEGTAAVDSASTSATSYLAEAEPQAIPPTAFNVVKPSQSWSSNRLLPIGMADKTCFGSLSWGILLAWPNHLSCDLSIGKGQRLDI